MTLSDISGDRLGERRHRSGKDLAYVAPARRDPGGDQEERARAGRAATQ